MISEQENPSYVNDFLNHMITILNKSQNTVKEYNYDLATFLKFIKMHYKLTDETDLKKIEYNDITIDTIKKIKLEDFYSFLSYLTKTYNSKPATRSRKVASLRVFFKYLCKVNILEKNPTLNLETPKSEKRLPNYLTLEDSKKLLQVAENEDTRNSIRNYTIITLFLNCGIRLSELVGINIEDIRFDECQMNVIGKGNKERAIYLNKACVKAIKEYLNIRPNKNLTPDAEKALFLSERKKRISRRAVQEIIYTELRNAGFDTKKYSVHKLRHTAATLMYQYGQVDIRSLQRALGHESIATTEIYTHVSDNQVREAFESNPLANI